MYRSNESAGPGYVHRCSSSGYSCPGGAAQQAITIAGGSLRRDAFAVSDMVTDGDGKPELCVFDAINATVRCHNSDSGYATAIERSWQVPNADFL